MVGVAREMKRRELELPLLIGGATTSKQHTAVKIAPEYTAPVVHVNDASRAVGTVSALLDADKRAELDQSNRASQERLRAVYDKKQAKPLLGYPAARERGLELEPSAAPEPPFWGRRDVDVPLSELRDYIDWTFFFSAWELKGKYPRILESPEYGEAARELFQHGQEMLDKIEREQLLQARGVYGFWPANRDGDDIVVFGPADTELARFFTLRQQEDKTGERPQFALADFVLPKRAGRDVIGGFAVTAGLGAEELAARHEKDHDDYSAILVKALADRLAEAFAEYLHERVRIELGLETRGQLSNEERIDERYQGIRPAFGYPACPDHSEKGTLFDLLGARDRGLDLTEHFAMLPAASVSGLYFWRPESRYFNVGRLGRDQLDDYARRKGVPRQQAERWLLSNLGYDPDADRRSTS